MENVSGIAFGISIFSIVITVFAFIAFIVLLIWIIKKKREPKGSKLFWPYLFIILMLLALFVANNRTKYDTIDEITMQNIVNDINVIIENSEQGLKSVPLNELSKSSTDKWFDEKFIDDEIKVDTYKEVRFESTKAKLEAFLVKIQNRYPYFEEELAFVKRMDARYREITKCLLNKNPQAQEMIDTNKKIENTVRKQFYIPDEQIRRIDVLRGEIMRSVDVMKLKDFGLTKIEKDLTKRKTMLTTFKSTIGKTETIRKEWIERIVEMLPDKQTVLKTLIIRSILVHILICFIILIIMICSKYIPQIIVSILISIIIIITTILTICLSIYTITLYYQFQSICPLNNDNFGFLNFTSKIPKNQQLCQSSDKMFFDNLSTELSNYPNIIRDYNMQQHIDEIRQKTIGEMKNYVFPDLTLVIAQFSILTDEIQKMDDIQTQLNCGLGEVIKNRTKFFRIDVIAYSKTIEPVQYVFEDYNTFLNTTLVKNLMDIFKKPYQSVLDSYKEAVDHIQTQTNSTDFSCQIIFDKYSNAGNTICQPFDGQVTLLWIYLIIIILSFNLSIIVHVLVLRNLKSGKKNGKLEEQQTPSPLPTSPQQQPLNV